MPVYHSSFNDVEASLCNCSVLPVRGGGRGPAAAAAAGDTDIVDEAIDYFRANVLFRSFEIKGGADRVLVYLTLFIQQCIATAAGSKNMDDGVSKLDALATSPFSLPGDAGFVLGSMLSTPDTSAERDQIRLYFKQLRTAVVKRLPAYLYTEAGQPNKWWMAFAKRKFMNKELK